MDRPVVNSYSELVDFLDRFAEHMDEFSYMNDKTVEAYVWDLAAVIRKIGDVDVGTQPGLTWQQIADAIYDAM